MQADRFREIYEQKAMAEGGGMVLGGAPKGYKCKTGKKGKNKEGNTYCEEYSNAAKAKAPKKPKVKRGPNSWNIYMKEVYEYNVAEAEKAGVAPPLYKELLQDEGIKVQYRSWKEKNYPQAPAAEPNKVAKAKVVGLPRL